MAPYLQTVTSFADVPVTDAGIDTAAFLKASEGVLGLFDLLGSAAFTVVQSDIKGNIAKVQTRYLAAPTKSTTLQQLVAAERAEVGAKPVAGEGLLWLLRGLDFTRGALAHAQARRADELVTAFQTSYDSTLKKHHNFVVKGVFAVALKACPRRADFYAKLRADPVAGKDAATEQELDADLNRWLTGLGNITRTMDAYYRDQAAAYGKGL